ncbi:hypothetical protein BU25DRAFT_469804 [Macroventuria anomochaeta]|uniref:Uncharacterized protein n=1 Tax=Macroventuria anomochaeta TaxID=301207 RepID=A0ACB6RY41_9PLEO|nr:uncharacterized protein BU25DRAFT_469804 [Macroventuria anomochaeta]KAF2626791.1 hypothetical protein BU25DRAFT_469804 [Macroventuria anomochaeta]
MEQKKTQKKIRKTRETLIGRATLTGVTSLLFSTNLDIVGKEAVLNGPPLLLQRSRIGANLESIKDRLLEGNEAGGKAASHRHQELELHNNFIDALSGAVGSEKLWRGVTGKLRDLLLEVRPLQRIAGRATLLDRPGTELGLVGQVSARLKNPTNGVDDLGEQGLSLGVGGVEGRDGLVVG